MKVLVACEFSGIVREAFKARGHDAVSCDLLPTEIPGEHYEGDVMNILNEGWDFAIFHPSCRFLAVSQAWCFNNPKFPNRERERERAIKFAEQLWKSKIKKKCLENPVGFLSTMSLLGKPTQIIQPWQYGHEETKSTCLWLHNLPALVPTKIMSVKNKNLTPTGQNKLPPTADRWKLRARTYTGIAEAMAMQWG